MVPDEEQNADQYFLNKLPDNLVEIYNENKSPAEQTGYEPTQFEDSDELSDLGTQINSDFNFD